ncbi:hydrogen peroxide-dependent heme synthase [Agrilactobacillus fermenti]|uniref:hydrogen peroxide-dependent heme synthase n=1 Tax=Agrilactobacillus fermenti TaxID=2586909 RepID=UPI001E288489|nr:hydrogen peroxide-dependent heme synthase [Agrilactobacillus fermenti]MCD2256729.1 heme-dependent peroxidase [Agrilactobacillus fermenti]
MEKPVETLEGWYCMHLLWSIETSKWRQLPADTKQARVQQFQKLLQQYSDQEAQGQGSHYLFNVSGHKGDLGLMILRETLDELNEIELELAKLPLFDCLKRGRSYVSVTEVGTYTGKPKSEKGWAYVNKHLKPELPQKPYICFYPMSKLRVPGANWYTLTYEQRQQYMHDHGVVGRTYAGKIWQYITGSIGLDDYEWGVTLFADTPLMFKKIIAEMRYYEASSVYGEFPYFVIGTHLDFEQLDHFFLSGWEA